jgi:Na+/H+ antiporter NhaD/arsenite permease-like protein
VAAVQNITSGLIAGVPVAFLKAISVGSVFMGANSYIGNGPNFMVKAICEENGINMPSFFGYMAWSVGILVPLFIVITLVFFI